MSTTPPMERARIKHDGTYFSMTVEFRRDEKTAQLMHEINDFFSGSKERLRDAGGDIYNAVLKSLAQRVIILSFIHGYNTLGIISLFDYNERNGGQEGWPKMDGTEGIKIVETNEPEIDESDLDITPVAGAQVA